MAQQTQESSDTLGILWPALLILTPVIVLCAIGVVGLRQDRRFVRVQAEERARESAVRLADELRERIRQGAIKIVHDRLRALLETNPAVKSTQPPVWPVGNIDVTARQISLPPLITSRREIPLVEQVMPPPQPLLTTSLPAETARLWREAHRHAVRNSTSETTIDRLKEFLDSSPPRRFEALAFYKLGRALQAAGNLAEAADAFQRAGEFSDIATESGFPLKPLAEWKALECDVTRLVQLREMADSTTVEDNALRSLPGSQRADEMNSLEQLQERFSRVASSAISEANPFTERILSSLHQWESAVREEFDEQWGNPIVPRWQKAWEVDQATRAFLREHPGLLSEDRGAPSAGWTEWRDRAWWIEARHKDLEMTIPENAENSGTPTDFVILPKETLVTAAKDAVSHLQSQLSPYESLSVRWHGKQLVSSEENAPILASEQASLVSGSNSASAQIEVGIHLADPDLLYARYRRRRFWFLSLIGASTVIGVVGLGITYRGIRQQIRLNQLKSQFVSSVSHELRAPLASIRLMVEGLHSKRIQDPAKQASYFDYLVKECRRLTTLVENVLDFSRIEQGRKEYRFEATDMSHLLDSTIEQMRPFASENEVTLKSEVHGCPIDVDADGHALQQVLTNLIDNALKHAPQGSEIRVGLEFPERDATEEASSVVRLWVEDQGPGVPPEEQSQIFERFYRLGSELRRETMGAGIGLNLVRHIVQAHAGRVYIDSEPGHGAQFVVELPSHRNTESESHKPA